MDASTAPSAAAHVEPVPAASSATTSTTTGSRNVSGAGPASVQQTVKDVGSSVQNHPATQSIKSSLQNGPIAETVKDQSAKTSAEFQSLKDTRVPPEQPAATGQPLTHYHSTFYSLLSWDNPRVTAISFVLLIATIFACRYLPALKWGFKALYLTLGATATAEIIGKAVLGQGLASSIRPRQYFTIPRDVLEASVEDVTQLINFFVIEFQRVIFAENVPVTILAFAAALTSYWLIKIVPLWGLALIGVSCAYMVPLIYVSNKEFIDTHLANAQGLVNEQASQVKDLANQHTARASSTIQQYAGDYSAMAQEYIGTARSRLQSSTSSAPAATSTSTSAKKQSTSGASVSSSSLCSKGFPTTPNQEPVNTKSTAQPIAAQ